MESDCVAGAAAPPFISDYTDVDYRRRYAGLLRLHPMPAEAIAELCLFRFWLACRAHAHSDPAADATAAAVPPLYLPAGWAPPRQAAGLAIDCTLGGWFGHLLESRFDLYDRFFQLGRNDDDPLGLDAVALALSCQLFVQPSAATRAWLREEVHALFADLLAAFAAMAPAPDRGGA